MFAYDFFFFAEAVFGRLDTKLWLARGAANAVMVPLIVISVARNPQWAVHLSVSRQAVFYTTTLLSAGIYLLIMALAAYHLRFLVATGVDFSNCYSFLVLG